MTDRPSATLVTHIGELTTNDPELGTRADAAVVLQGDRITWVGDAAAAPAADAVFDVGGPRGAARLGRLAHPPAVRGGPGGRVRRPDGR